jgi:hypothetical protein
MNLVNIFKKDWLHSKWLLVAHFLPFVKYTNDAPPQAQRPNPTPINLPRKKT